MAFPDESGPIERQPLDRHQKVRELFEKALEHSESQRLSYLDSACAGDAGLLQDVVRLLLANRNSQSFLEEPKEKLPDKIGRYQVTAELGRGAMGIVYQAKDPLIGRTVAVKTINLKAFSRPDEARFLQQQLLKEATAAGQLSHPNIVTIHDMGIDGEVAFIAMEKMEGASLHELLAPGEKLAPPRVLGILRQCADALDYAHQNSIVHRDVKPANIMLHKAGQVKITDFGIAKNTLSQQQTGFGITMGTPSYMSPEQIRGETLDGRSDQFSLAVVAYELLTGVKPFRADTMPELLALIRDGARPSAYAANPQLLPTVDVVFQKALGRYPNERYKNCAAFVSALESSLTPQPAVATLETTQSATPVTAHEGMPKKALTVLLAGIAFIALAGTAAYKLFYPHAVPPEALPTALTTSQKTPTKPLVAPVVMLFSADPGLSGKPPSLRWDVHDATEVFIDPQVGSVAPSGSADVNPTATTTYQLSASGPGGNVTATATIEIVDRSKPSAMSAAPRILSFAAVPPVVKKGAQFELKWRVEGDVSDLSIDHGIGAVHGDNYSAVATETTAFTLTARSKTGIVTQQAVVRVDAGRVDSEAPSPVTLPEPAPDPQKLFESAVAMRNAGQAADAVPLFRQAAELGNVNAMLEMGKTLLAGHDAPQDYSQALTWFRKAADAGNPSAMVFVGVMTGKGVGTAKDEIQAAAWYRRAADAGYPVAMDTLGVLYASGQGVQKDPAEAVRWYQKAADHGNVAGIAHLASAYENGFGVDRSVKDAIHWYQLAADKGDRQAAARLQHLTAVAATPTTPVPSPPLIVTPPAQPYRPAPVPSAPGNGFSVAGSQRWVDSGIALNAGDSVKITASGNIVVNVNGQAAGMTPAGLAATNCNGSPASYGRELAVPAPMAPCWSLIGRIGPNGRIFPIGTLRVVTAPAAGRLLLGVNDSNPAGNSGFWNVAFTVIPGSTAPAPQPIATQPVAAQPVAKADQLQLTSITPAAINGKKSQKYTLAGTALTMKTVIQLANLRVYIGSKSGVADYYPAEAAKDGSSIKIYIGPLPANVTSVRIMAQQPGSPTAYLTVPVKR